MPRPKRQAAIHSRVIQACQHSDEDSEESYNESASDEADEADEDMRTAHLRADLRGAGSKDVNEAVTDAKGNVWTVKNSMPISL